MLDPDFGWHIRMGEIITQSGIPHHDPLSYTMKQYPFVDHEWLTNMVMYMTYHGGGVGAVSVLYAFLFFLIILVLVRGSGGGFPEIFVLVFTSLLGFGGIRPQVLGWLLLALWIREIQKLKHNNIFLLLLQLIWVNTHGSFFLGWGTYVLLFLIEQVKKEKKAFSLTMCIVLFFITFINPYTYRIWWEVIMQVSDTSLRWRIMEWVPGVFIIDISFWLYVCIFISLFITLIKKVLLSQKVLIIIFFLMAVSTARNMPLFLITSSVVFIDLWRELERRVPKEKKGVFVFFKQALVAIFFFVSVFGVFQLVMQYKSINKIYPTKATLFMQQNKKNGNIFSLYEWGGYIVWRLPESKIFIDGRMPSWRWSQGGSSQSNNADFEYRKIMKEMGNFDYYKKKYDIEYILIDKDKKKEHLLKKYKKIYEDGVAVLYEL